MNESELSKLLRLKRYEQPDKKYFDSFLMDFQRRQRAELLQRPSWQIAIDRMHAFFGEGIFPRIGYAAATAAVLMFAGVTTMHNLRDNRELATEQAVVKTDARALASIKAKSRPQMVASNPHYIMDARPVSYEPSFSF